MVAGGGGVVKSDKAMLHVTMLSLEFYVCKQEYHMSIRCDFVSFYHTLLTLFSPGKAVAINDATSTHLQQTSLQCLDGWVKDADCKIPSCGRASNDSTSCTWAACRRRRHRLPHPSSMAAHAG